MKARKLLLSLLLLTSMAGFSATFNVTASDSGMSFSPNSITISSGDVIRFIIGSIHNAVEVTTSTGTTPLVGGFSVGQGQTEDVTLSVGTHWYVCQFHFGMRGTIIVSALGVNDFQLAKSFSVFPNPSDGFVNIKASQSSFDLPYAIMDQGGRMVSAGRLSDITTLIDLGQLASGIYFLQVGEDRRQNFKVIKN